MSSGILMISENVRRIRKARELSQDKLAKLASITLTTLVKIESGANDNPTIKTLKKIAEALKVTVNDLLEDESEKPDSR